MKRILVTLLLLAAISSIMAAEKPLDLNDLDMDKKDVQPNIGLQADLERRSTMLKWHQWLGIAALVPMATDYFLGDNAKHDTEIRNWHMGLGIATTTLYASAALFAIFAPKPDGIKDTGSTKFHRWLSYIHLPLMIIVPILGNAARQQIEDGQRVSGVASLHGAAATTLLATYAISITVLAFNF